jgi:alkanesulfonate monooxygenase SsuD/methylene tetrahydromethanopterin reductase-like flavin-dependent oxidoreductase (luciferase family)
VVRIGFKVPSPAPDWPTIEAVWRRGGELDVFDSAWTNDHLELDGPTWEGWTTLAVLAPHVPGKTVGHLVLASPFRHPAVLAKGAVVLDHATRGRFVLGLGVGSWPRDFEIYGLPLPPIAERLRDLEAQLKVLRALFGRDSVAPHTIETGPYTVRDARFDPAPFTPGGPPIWLGTQGEKIGLRLVAQYADGWNFDGSGDPTTFGRKLDALRAHCERLDRDAGEITVSVQLVVGDDLVALREQAESFLRSGAEEVIFYLDLRRGVEGIEAVAAEVAAPLRDRFA